METARSVKEDRSEVNAIVGCKAEICLQVSPGKIDCHCRVSPLCLHPHVQMWTATFVQEDGASMVLLNDSPYGHAK